MYLLGYDIGSGSIKAALVDAQTQKVIHVEAYPQQEMDMISRQSGWAEQQPEVWWQDLCIATQKLLAATRISPKSIKAIGIGYQMHGLVLIDEDQRVLRPSIIWCDSRAVEIGKQAYTSIGVDYCQENLLNAPGNFTATKLKWVKDNEPEIYKRIHKVLLPGDYIAMKLTGNALTTIAGLSEGVFWDFKTRTLAQPVLDFFEFDPKLIADRVPTFSLQGRLTRRAAEQTGLQIGTPLTYRAGDQPNNALALNVLEPGEIAASSGTSGVVYGIVDKLVADPDSRVNTFAHVNYEANFDRLGVLLCLNGAGSTYSWIKHQIARSDRSYADMERMLTSVPVGADGLCILPFGNGAERILDNKNINAHIQNLEFNRHTRAHLYRAAIEGVAFSFVYGVNLLKNLGIEVDVIRVANDNMFQSPTFSRTIATLLNSQIEMVDTTGAIGAARAAGVKSGPYATITEALSGIQPSTIYEPDLNFALCTQAYSYWVSSLNNQQRGPALNKNSLKLLRTKNDQLNQELVEKQKLLQHQALQLVAKSDLLDDIKNTLLQIPIANITQRKKVKSLLKKIESTANKDREWASFEALYDLQNNDFCKRLKAIFPSLTITDVKLCLFLRNQLSTKDIAEQMNLSIRGVETRRYRLRQKMHLDKGVNLIQYLERI